MPPQMFRDKIGVVVEGTMTEAGHFEGRKLMVSHDNEYRTPEDKNVDIRELMRSTKGLEEGAK
jgi:cytochrome c-type biogenesis protein CcmE